MLKQVSYSSTAQIVSEFTRDYEKLLDALKSLKNGDSACLEEGLNKISDLEIFRSTLVTLLLRSKKCLMIIISKCLMMMTLILL